MTWLERVDGDLYDVASRLKGVDERYELYFNRRSRKFEVYIGGALQFAVPFDSLDERTIVYAKKTRIERLDLIVEEIDENNRRIDEENIKKARDGVASSLCV